MAAPNLTITQVFFQQLQPVGSTIALEYRPITSTSWTTYSSSIPISQTGVLSSPAVISGLTENVFYAVRATNNICGDEYIENFRYVPPSGTDTCCPVGWTKSADGTNCYKVTSVPATHTPASPALTACHFTDSSYNSYGVVFYKQNGFNLDGTWNINSPATPALNPNMYTQRTPSLFPNANVTVYTSGPFTNASATTTLGRLNKAGLWVCGNPTYTASPVGFAYTVNAPASKYYLIGCGADNYATIKVNGTTLVQQDQNTTSSASYLNDPVNKQQLFKYWNVYPVFLNAGPNAIQMIGTNVASVGVLGFEIYDATEAQLIACTTDTQVNNFIVFSTKDIPDGTLFDIGNYNCDAYPGYSLVNDGGVYYCQLIENQTPTPC